MSGLAMILLGLVGAWMFLRLSRSPRLVAHTARSQAWLRRLFGRPPRNDALTRRGLRAGGLACAAGCLLIAMLGAFIAGQAAR